MVENKGSIPFVGSAMSIYGIGPSVNFDPTNFFTSTISGLGLSRSPNAIFGSVIAIVINTVKRVFGRGFAAHIFQEVQIRIAPAFANLDLSATPFRIAFVLFVVASVLHMSVSAILSGSVLSLAVNALPGIGNRNSFSVKTSARLALTFSQHSGSNRFFNATLASTFPQSPWHVTTGEILFKDGPASENTSLQTLNWSHMETLALALNGVKGILRG